MLDRIIFGDNQFFGINHMSEEKAKVLAEKFWDLKSIIDVIDIAYNCGIRAFMLNTNERAMEICDYIRLNRNLYNDISFYPSMPYAHKYANSVAEKGIFGALRDTLIAGSSVGEIASILSKGGTSLFDRDIIKVMQLLIDIEMKIFRNLDVKVIFLQNIVTDLLLGFGNKNIFLAFYDYIQSKYRVQAGFVTMNMPKLVDFLLDCGIENPVICSSINSAGYFMNPDMKTYEDKLRDPNLHIIAMSILASGALTPSEAVRYVCNFPAVKSIVFGASSRAHIEETYKLINN
jgi:hypothetical protein